MTRCLSTRGGEIDFPAYIPVTTFGDRYPLDGLIQPYLPRLAPAVMVSAFYARQMKHPLSIPMFVDSGGFAALFSNSRVVRQGQLGIIERILDDGSVELTTPLEVLDLQEDVADVAFTLDFPIPPGTDEVEAHRRFELTQHNAIWALENRRRKDLPLFACIQSWDADSATAAARDLAHYDFDGFAIGGLVPRIRDRELMFAIVEAVRKDIGDRPLHVFGLGHPDLVKGLFHRGVDSVDSSSYVKLAADGRWWGDPTVRIPDPSPTDRLQLALCNLAAATSTTLPLALSSITYGPGSLFDRFREARPEDPGRRPESGDLRVQEMPLPRYGAA